MTTLEEIAKIIGVAPGRKLKKRILEQLKKVPYVPFPTAFHTVDIIPIVYKDFGMKILLGRKHNSNEWRFIGGFVEPTNSTEEAAARELHEETNIYIDDLNRFQYISSQFVDDRRYKQSCHKVTTSIFTITLTEEEAMQALGGDDIEEVKWVDYIEIYSNPNENIISFHIPLFNKFVKYLGL